MTRTPRRIALVASSFAPHFGGVEEHVAQVARELQRRGDTVEVWTVDRGLRPTGPFVGAGSLPIPVRYLKTPLPARTPAAVGRFALRGPVAWASWSRAARRLRPQILHVHCFGPNGVYAERLARSTGVPLIVTSHGETLGDDNGVYGRSALLRSSLRRALALASSVTAPSHFVLDDLRRNYGLARGETIPNGVDLTVSATKWPGRGRPYLFAVGRWGAQKGFDLLIRAFTAANVPELDLVIGGDGPLRADLERQIALADLASRVRMPGRLSPQEVASWMAGAAAVVVPSRQESFGIVALEAWRAGAPLIMTSRGGAPEFVRDQEDGLLVDPMDHAALRAALERVATDAELRDRLGRNGRARVTDFTWSRVVDEYERLYATAMGE